MRFGSKIKTTTFLAAALVSFDANYLNQGGPPAAIWLAGAVAGSPAVTALRTPGRGADRRLADWPVLIGTTSTPEDIGTDTSEPRRMTWGCGGGLEWREPGTGSQRLTADTLVVCGKHDLRGREVRLTIRARHLELVRARIVTEADGFFDLRAERLTLDGPSLVASRAPASTEPPFSSSANISVSAREVDGSGRLDVETRGADWAKE